MNTTNTTPRPNQQKSKNKPHQIFDTPREHAQQSLFIATTFGLIDKVTEIIKNPRDAQLINGQDYLGRTPLMIAISLSNTSMCQFLLSQKDVNVNLKTYLDHKTALIMASERGLRSVVQTLLSMNALIDDVDSEHKTALMYAAEKGNFSTVTALLQANPSVNLRDVHGRTALIYSIKDRSFNLLGNSNVIIISGLLQAGALFEIKDKYNRDALHYVDETSQRTELAHMFEKALKKPFDAPHE